MACKTGVKLPNGEYSKMYLDLVHLNSLKGLRHLANYVYAVYSQASIQTAMDAAGYTRNKQGEHEALDIFNYLNVGDWIAESSTPNIMVYEEQIGAIDPSTMNPIEYSDGKEVFEKCKSFNNSHNTVMAVPIQKGNTFTIKVMTVDNRNSYTRSSINLKLEAYEVAERAFSTRGIDINSSEFDDYKNLINPERIQGFVQYLNSLKSTPPNVLSLRDINLLLILNKNNPLLSRLQLRFNSNGVDASILDVANHIYTMYHTTHNTSYSQSDQLRMGLLLNDSMQMPINLSLILQDIQDAIDNYKATSEYDALQESIDELKKFDLDSALEVFNGEITKLSEISGNAMHIVRRQMLRMEKEQGVTQELLDLNQTYLELRKDYLSKKFYNGTITALQLAAKALQKAYNIYTNHQVQGSKLEVSNEKTRELMDLEDNLSAYDFVVEGAANIENLILDENLTLLEIQAIKQYADKVKDTIRKFRSQLLEHKRNIMRDLCVDILGENIPLMNDKTAQALSVADIVTMVENDSGISNYLFSIARQSNPLVAAMGEVIRDAQSQRDDLYVRFNRRLSVARNKLVAASKKAGRKNTSTTFMYSGDSEHIISNIDWMAYKDAYNKAAKGFRTQGLLGLDLKLAMLIWEEQNTVEIVVDNTNGRTERVPNDDYFIDNLSQLTPELLEYYCEVMLIKGELGSLLPEYARDLYRAPLVRKNFIDALATAGKDINGKKLGVRKSLINMAKAIGKQILKVYKADERDTDLMTPDNLTEYSPEDVMETISDLRGNVLKKIPIYHFNLLDKPEDLLKDFDHGLKMLAQTAVNYNCMALVQNTVEFMGDFIKGKPTKAKNNFNQALVSKVDSTIKFLVASTNNTATANIINAALNSLFYGIHNIDKGSPVWKKIVKNLLFYNSMKSLTLNIKGILSNGFVGYLQDVIEGIGGRWFNLWHLFLGTLDVIGDRTIGNPKEWGDFFTGKKKLKLIGSWGCIFDDLWDIPDSEAVLLRELFDSSTSTFRETKRFHSNFFRRLWSHDLKFEGYKMGENFIHQVNMYSLLRGTKIKINGKKTSLRHAFDVVQNSEGYYELQLKQGATDLKGNALNIKLLTDGKNSVKRILRHINQGCHGAMTTEDYGAIHLLMIGKAIMQFRQWMVEHVSKRWRKAHYDADLGRFVEGFHRTNNRMLVNNLVRKPISWLLKNIFNVRRDYKWLHQRLIFELSSLSPEERQEYMKDYKANIGKAMGEWAILVLLYVVSGMLGDPKDWKNKWARRQAIYQVRRAIVDTQGFIAYPGAIHEGETILNSPISGVARVDELTYALWGLVNGDVLKEYKRGANKGNNVYLHKFGNAYIPFKGRIEKEQDFLTSESVFNVMNQ